MISNSLWVESSCDFFSKPLEYTDDNVYSACNGLTGKESLKKLAQNFAGNLAQTVVSAVAIPFQILVGIFSCLNQCAVGNWKEGLEELGWGFGTAGVHLVGVLCCPVIAAGNLTAMGLGSVYLVYKWNEQLELPSLESIRQRLMESMSQRFMQMRPPEQS